MLSKKERDLLDSTEFKVSLTTVIDHLHDMDRPVPFDKLTEDGMKALAVRNMPAFLKAMRGQLSDDLEANMIAALAIFVYYMEKYELAQPADLYTPIQTAQFEYVMDEIPVDYTPAWTQLVNQEPGSIEDQTILEEE